MDTSVRHVTLANGETLRFDVASLNVGSTLSLPEQQGDHLPHLLAMRPLSSLPQRWQALRDDVEQLPHGASQRVVSVGGGAAGCETLMSVLGQLRHQRPDIDWQGHLLSASRTLLPDAGRLPRWLTLRALARAGIQVHRQRRGETLIEGGVLTTQGAFVAADIVLWATGAVGHGWLSKTQLPLDKQRFIEVENTLEVVGQTGLFAAGDCAAYDPPLPNAGVYAVRMGPHLADNLRRACHSEALAAWQPQDAYWH